jgi:hypothetical protein
MNKPAKAQRIDEFFPASCIRCTPLILEVIFGEMGLITS